MPTKNFLQGSAESDGTSSQMRDMYFSLNENDFQTSEETKDFEETANDDGHSGIYQYEGAEMNEDEITIEEAENNSDVNYVSKIRPYKKGPGFAAIAGMDNLKKKLTDEIVKPILHPEKYREYGLTQPNGVLFYGPYGCGKTYIAERIAEECHTSYVAVTNSDITGTRWGEAQKKIKALFADARLHAPCIIFLDEFEMMAPDRRTSSENAPFKIEEADELFMQINNCGAKGVFVICATNLPDMIDPALLRAGRLENKIYIGLPDEETRKAVFEMNMRDCRHKDNIDYGKLANLTQGRITADLSMIVKKAKLFACNHDMKVTQELIERIIAEEKPSVKDSAMKKMEEEKRRYENDKAERRIGFK